MNFRSISLCLCFAIPTALAAERPADKLLKQFEQQIIGEFDNYNQVNFETNDFLKAEDIPATKHARLYKKVVKLAAPQLGEYVFYEQTHQGGQEQPIYRKSIMVLTADYKANALIAKNYKLVEDLDVLKEQNRLSHKQLKPLGDDCDTRFSLRGTSFVGKINQKRCKVASKHGGHVFIGGDFVISESGYWHLEAGYDAQGKMLFGRADQQFYQLTRAKRFNCWAAFKTNKLKENGEPYWDFFSGLSLHNQGDIAKFTTTDSESKHYFIRLKETIFPSGNRPDVFEVFVHEDTELARKQYKQALAYTWTNADAKRLGLNLRWMQTSCSLATN